MLPTMSVMENLYMGRMPTRSGRIRWKDMEERSGLAAGDRQVTRVAGRLGGS